MRSQEARPTRCLTKHAFCAKCVYNEADLRDSVGSNTGEEDRVSRPPPRPRERTAPDTETDR